MNNKMKHSFATECEEFNSYVQATKVSEKKDTCNGFSKKG